MKRYPALIMALGLAGCSSSVEDPVVTELLGKVVVEGVDLDLSAPQGHKGELLSKRFFNKPYEKQFPRLGTENYVANWQKFRDRLLSRAEAGKFDVDSLDRVLERLRPRQQDGNARIPVGAFAARNGTESVWIVILKWERADWENLGHIEVIAFGMKDGVEVDSIRCE